MKVLSRILMIVTVAAASGNIFPQHDSNQGNKSDPGNVVLDYNSDIVPVLKFCCERHHYFDFTSRTCVHSGERLEPHFYTRDGESIDEEVAFQNVTELNSCPSYMLSNSEFRILSTGEIQLRDINRLDQAFSDNLIPNEKFCLLWLSENDTFQVSALVCFPADNDEVSLFRTVVNVYLLPISMAISAIFLLATFLIYCLVSELQDLLGKSLMCSVAALCFSKVFGVIAKSLSNHLTFGQCVTVGLLMHIGFLIAFFWLNVISIILFVSVCFQRISCHSRKKWFILSSVYAFGIPLIIMGLVLIHDFTSQFDNAAVPKPGFGMTSCGFTNRGSQVVYFYAPMSILLGINLILFCASACRLFILSKQSSAFVFQFTHYLKLLVLMGIPWIFEVLSFFLAEDFQLSAATFIWLAFDVFNALQGVVIFLVFACRRAVFARVSETVCGSSYARNKYPDVFMQHANEETNEAFTQDLRLMDADSRT